MDIKEYISNFTNHPVLFVGTGISLRYLKNSFTWDSLLEKISYIVYQYEEVYLDIKARCTKIGGGFDYPRIASILENAFDDKLKKERHGEFSFINDSYYQHIKEGNPISRFKLFLAHLFSDLTIKNSKKEELDLLKQLSNNISSIITTNYDRLLETISNFNPLVSNDILLTNPYGSLYKIHGCILKPEKIVITAEDYEKSKYQNELIKAQLLSLFIHNPIIFLGYGIQDENVNGILKTVFNYVGDNQEMIKRIRNNFLLVEYEEDSENTIVSDYDLKIDGVTIQIKKLKTDNYSSLYKALIEAKYPISAMDVKKVQSIMYGYRDTVNTIKQTIFKERVIRTHLSADDFIANYFEILDNKDIETIKVIDNITISSHQYFPIYGFLGVYNKLKNKVKIKKIQQDILNKFMASENKKKVVKFPQYNDIKDIYSDPNIATSFKHPCVMWNVWNDNIGLDNLEKYLRDYPNEDKKDSKYRRLVSLYDLKKYGSK